MLGGQANQWWKMVGADGREFGANSEESYSRSASSDSSTSSSSAADETSSREIVQQRVFRGANNTEQRVVGDVGRSQEHRSAVSGHPCDPLPNSGEGVKDLSQNNGPGSSEGEAQRDADAATKQEDQKQDAQTNDCVTEGALVEVLSSLNLAPRPQTPKLENEEPLRQKVGLIYDPIMEQHICQSGKC